VNLCFDFRPRLRERISSRVGWFDPMGTSV